MKSIEMIYVSFPNKETALNICNRLVNIKLAACANMFPIHNAYIWNEQMTNEDEWVGLLKTSKDATQHLFQKIEELHPYEVPCILQMTVKSNPIYADWVSSQIDVSKI